MFGFFFLFILLQLLGCMNLNVLFIILSWDKRQKFLLILWLMCSLLIGHFDKQILNCFELITWWFEWECPHSLTYLNGPQVVKLFFGKDQEAGHWWRRCATRGGLWPGSSLCLCLSLPFSLSPSCSHSALGLWDRARLSTTAPGSWLPACCHAPYHDGQTHPLKE